MRWKAPFPVVVAVLCVFAMGHLTSANPWRTNPAFPRKLRKGHSPHGEKLSSSQDSNTFPHLAHSDEDLGIVNVAMPPFSADPSGQKDATQALQSAIEYGRAHRLTIYVPLGRYKVSDTINCTEHAHGRFQPIVIVGQKAKTFRYGQIQAPNRPEFFLPENTPGFMDATKPKYIVHFWEDDSLPAKDKQALKKSNDTGSEEYNLDSEIRTNVNFNQVIQGINVVVGDGNHGAIGIRLRGAQGSAVEDCLVDLGKDGLIGVVGACGSGGSHAGVTVLGGKYGLDFRMAQPAPTITGATLINQSCSSLLYAGLQTLTAVGIKISASQSVEETLGIIASVPPEVEGEPSPWMPAEGSECFLPELPPDIQPAQPSLSGQISLIDAEISLDTACQSCVAITAPRDLYLKNVYIRGFPYLLRLRTGKGGDSKVSNKSPAQEWARIDEAAYTVQPPVMTKKKGKGGSVVLDYVSTIWVDGKREVTNETHITFSAPSPEEDVVSKHLWDEASFPSFQSEGAVSVTMPPYNAKGDGKHDDTAAIQQAIDDHDIVVVPKGYYVVSKTIQFRQNTKVVGVGRTSSVFILPTDGSGFETGPSASPEPILATFKGEGANAIAFLMIAKWNTSPNTYAFLWQVYGESCVWRQGFAFTTGTNFLTSPTHRYSNQLKDNSMPAVIPNATHPLMVITGGGKFYNLENEDYLHESPSYRHLLVTNSSGGLRFYQLNTEHGRGDANTEIASSSNIEVFGLKSEGNFVILWLRNVENVTLYGYGGNAAALPMTDKYPTGYAQYTPSLFRVENAKNTRLVHLNDYGRIQGGNSTFFAGQGYDPHLWSMLLDVSRDVSTPPMDRPVFYLIN